MHRIVFLEGVCLVAFPHQDHNRANTTEDSISGSLVGFPRRVKIRQTIEKRILVDQDFFGHLALAGNLVATCVSGYHSFLR